ncbi:phage portal protein [Suttonella ornithocola]|uniref:Phage portal protein, HK97 family n=1 Tax=Suttonella ornithocola TaxID=279832 RepID=A0A380MRI2_9GAMM|nr:phage portal protein [Suttonella ornithocola]SUO95249.1 phage portal protein, HK97 family [Suttonella ornithocola]
MNITLNTAAVREWLGGLFGRQRLDKNATVYPYDSTPTPMGSSVSVDNSLKLSAVWACVRLRSQTISTLPIHLRDTEKNISDNHPLYKLLHDAPNADMCASEFWEVMIASLDLWGNAYALITRGGNRIISLEPLDPQAMRVKRDKTGAIIYQYSKTGYADEYSEADIFHVRGFTLDGLTGLSPIQYAAEAIGAQMDLNRFTANDWKKGLKIGGFFKFPTLLSPEQRQVFRENLVRYQQPENADSYMLLENGIEPVTANGIKINPKDAQVIESKYFGIEEICRAFGVPPQLIGHYDKASSWASSLEGMNQGFLTYSLRPTLVRIEQTISRKLLTPIERQQYRPKFAVEGLLRANSGERANFYNLMVQNGIMTRNDVRALEDLPRIEGADVLTVQLNMTTIDNVGKEPVKDSTDRTTE